MSVVSRDRHGELLEKLLETTQDIFIFEALAKGLTKETIRTLLRVSNDRVTRVSMIRRKMPRNGE
jgi:hypothetical protein